MPTVSPLMRPAFPYADGFPLFFANLAFSYANLAFPYAVCRSPRPILPLSCPALPSPVPGTRESKLSGKPHVQGLLLQQAIAEIPFEWRSPIQYAVSYWGSPVYIVSLCSKLLEKSHLWAVFCNKLLGKSHFWCLLLPLENQP